MKHWAVTQSSSSTADASIDNDQRYAYRDGGVEVVGGDSDQTVASGASRPGDLVTRSATTDVEMATAAGDVRCGVPAAVDIDPVAGPARPPPRPLVVRIAKDDGLAAKAEDFSESLVSILESVKDNVASFGSLARNSEWFLSLKSDAAKDRMMSAGSLKARGCTFYVRSADKTQFSARVHWAPPFIPNAAIVKVLEETCKVQYITLERSTSKGFDGIPMGIRRLVLTGIKDDIPHTFNIINPKTNKNFELFVTISGRRPMCFKCKQTGHYRSDRFYAPLPEVRGVWPHFRVVRHGEFLFERTSRFDKTQE